MTRHASGVRALAGRRWFRWSLGLLLFVGVIVAAVVGGSFLLSSSPASDPVAWARLGTQDVHSLSFGEGTDHLLFGHHDGVLESRDGGRTWEALPANADAMAMAVEGSSIVIAGHYVFRESTDGGRTWSDVPADLPNLDIHAFTRGVADPARMWAYLAEGGVYESADGGRHWQKVNDGHVRHLIAVVGDGRDALLGLHPLTGLVRSNDGGRSWSPISTPPLAPVTSLAATTSGEVVLLGGPRGLFRSDDGGRSWRQILDMGTVLALAITSDGRTVVAGTADTSFYRSDDGGRSWPAP